MACRADSAWPRDRCNSTRSRSTSTKPAVARGASRVSIASSRSRLAKPAYHADLHAHSIRSDGVYEPAELVRLAAERGVETLALSDHDTLAGAADAIAAGERLGVRVIPSIELNTESRWGDVHVLGYFVDPHDAEL